VLTWQIAVADVDVAMERCRAADVDFELEHNDPAPGWSYRRPKFELKGRLREVGVRQSPETVES
jgi:hypothetical protein